MAGIRAILLASHAAQPRTAIFPTSWRPICIDRATIALLLKIPAGSSCRFIYFRDRRPPTARRTSATRSGADSSADLVDLDVNPRAICRVDNLVQPVHTHLVQVARCQVNLDAIIRPVHDDIRVTGDRNLEASYVQPAFGDPVVRMRRNALARVQFAAEQPVRTPPKGEPVYQVNEFGRRSRPLFGHRRTYAARILEFERTHSRLQGNDIDGREP